MRRSDSQIFYIIEGFLLLASFGFLFAYTAFYRNIYLLIPVLVIRVWGFVIEVIEIKETKALYCHDFWNWFDLLRLITTLFYFII